MPSPNPTTTSFGGTATENDIVSFLGGDAPANPDTQPGGGDEGNNNQPTPEPTPAPTEPPADGAAAGDKAAGTPAGTGDKAKDNQAPARPKLAPGDLVDRATGEIVKAGNERRYYEMAHTERQKRSTAEQQLGTLQRDFDTYKQTVTQVNQYNLKPEAMAEGARLMHLWGTNPEAAVEEILGTAIAIGIDLSKFNLASINTKAIQGLIDQKLQPITSAQEQQREQADLRANGEKQLNTFLAENREAETCLMAVSRLMEHDASLANLQQSYDRLSAWAMRNGAQHALPLIDTVLGQKPELSVGEAWLLVQDWAEAKQLDLSKPLQSAPAGSNTATKPVPQGGRNIVVPNGQGAAQPKIEMLPVGSSIDDRIKLAFRQAGLDPNKI